MSLAADIAGRKQRLYRALKPYGWYVLGLTIFGLLIMFMGQVAKSGSQAVQSGSSVQTFLGVFLGAGVPALGLLGTFLYAGNPISKAYKPLFCDSCGKLATAYYCYHCGTKVEASDPRHSLYFACHRCNRHPESYRCKCDAISVITGRGHPARDVDHSNDKEIQLEQIKKFLNNELKEVQLRLAHSTERSLSLAKAKADQLERMRELKEEGKITDDHYQIVCAEIKKWTL